MSGKVGGTSGQGRNRNNDQASRRLTPGGGLSLVENVNGASIRVDSGKSGPGASLGELTMWLSAQLAVDSANDVGRELGVWMGALCSSRPHPREWPPGTWRTEIESCATVMSPIL